MEPESITVSHMDSMHVRVDARAASKSTVRERMFALTTGRLLTSTASQLTRSQYELVFDFFMHHMFMPADRSARDRAVERLYDAMKSVTILDCADNLRDSVELTRLAHSLDEGFLTILMRRQYANVEQIGAEDIGSALREERRPFERKRQIELLARNMRFFHRVAHAPFARFMLPAFKKAAQASGVECLVEQIDAGYCVARAIRNMDAIVNPMLRAEHLYIDALFDSPEFDRKQSQRGALS